MYFYPGNAFFQTLLRNPIGIVEEIVICALNTGCKLVYAGSTHLRTYIEGHELLIFRRDPINELH